MREEQKRDGVIDGGSPVGSEGVSKAGIKRGQEGGEKRKRESKARVEVKKNSTYASLVVKCIIFNDDDDDNFPQEASCPPKMV